MESGHLVGSKVLRYRRRRGEQELLELGAGPWMRLEKSLCWWRLGSACHFEIRKKAWLPERKRGQLVIERFTDEIEVVRPLDAVRERCSFLATVGEEDELPSAARRSR